MSNVSRNIENILVVGVGRMGSAIVEGWLQQGIQASSIHLIDNDANILEAFQKRGLNTYLSVENVPENIVFDIFLLALKPQVIVKQVAQFNRLLSEKTCLVSVAAGVMADSLKQWLPNAQHIVRVMPNTPAMIGKGVMVGYSDKQVVLSETIEGLFSTLGRFFWVEDEHQMHAVTAISGSGPAYLFYFAQCFVEAAQTLGLDDSLAKELALETLIGATNLIDQSGEEVETLRKNVTSPNGTTQAGLEALMKDRVFKQYLESCCQAAAKRSIELA